MEERVRLKEQIMRSSKVSTDKKMVGRRINNQPCRCFGLLLPKDMNIFPKWVKIKNLMLIFQYYVYHLETILKRSSVKIAFIQLKMLIYFRKLTFIFSHHYLHSKYLISNLKFSDWSESFYNVHLKTYKTGQLT